MRCTCRRRRSSRRCSRSSGAALGLRCLLGSGRRFVRGIKERLEASSDEQRVNGAVVAWILVLMSIVQHITWAQDQGATLLLDVA